jgi:hypothetical protein
MLLIPGSLPTDRATLNALCENLPSHSEIAKWLRACEVEAVEGSWSDWERKLPATALTPALSRAAGEGVAIATPLHAALGLTDLTLLDPSQLQLSDADSRALCAACDAHVREDGLQLEYVSAYEWRIVTERDIKVLAERPEWIVGEPMRPNLPRGDDGRLVERWMNELQMLLFTHPVNAARAERRLPPINVVWLWGFDVLQSAASDHVDARMLHAFRAGDVAAWQRVWGEIATNVVPSDCIVIGDARPRLKLTFARSKKPGLFSWFAKKPTLADVLLQLRESAFDTSPYGTGRPQGE